MSRDVPCPHCNFVIPVEGRLPGEIRCPDCQQTFDPAYALEKASKPIPMSAGNGMTPGLIALIIFAVLICLVPVYMILQYGCRCF